MGREGRRLHANRMNPDNILNTNNKLQSKLTQRQDFKGIKQGYA